DWLQGRWSWPPLESDPAVFLALARDLLIGGGAAADGSGQALPPLQQELLGSLPPLPHFGEVLSFDEDGPNALCESRALLVCFHSAPSGRPGLHPAQAAAAAASAADAGGQVFFIRQVPGLDAACGIIALLHALLNAGLLGAPGGTVAGHWPEGGPMRRWLEALPPSASPADRGRALVNDVGIRAIYRTHATGGQSRMPLSPIWTWVTLLPALAWVVSAAWVLFARGTKVLSIYLCFSLACLLVCALIWRLSGGRCPCGGWSATSCASPSGRGACCSWTGSQTPPRTSEPARAPSRAPRWSSFAARCCRRCPGRTRVPSWPCPRQRRSPEGTAAGFRWVLLRARPRASGGFS
ncbi:unnamed protein product, partial [Prorocentrum cordatum]